MVCSVATIYEPREHDFLCLYSNCSSVCLGCCLKRTMKDCLQVFTWAAMLSHFLWIGYISVHADMAILGMRLELPLKKNHWILASLSLSFQGLTKQNPVLETQMSFLQLLGYISTWEPLVNNKERIISFQFIVNATKEIVNEAWKEEKKNEWWDHVEGVAFLFFCTLEATPSTRAGRAALFVMIILSQCFYCLLICSS